MWRPRERNRKRGGGGEERENKYLTLLMSRNTNTKDRHKEGQQRFPPSYSSVLIHFLPKSKDIHGAASCTSHTKIRLNWAFSDNQQVSSTSYIFMELSECISAEQWKEISAESAKNEGK